MPQYLAIRVFHIAIFHSDLVVLKIHANRQDNYDDDNYVHKEENGNDVPIMFIVVAMLST